MSNNNLWFCAGPATSFPDIATLPQVPDSNPSTTTKPNRRTQTSTPKLQLTIPAPCTQPNDYNDPDDPSLPSSSAAKIFQVPKRTAANPSIQLPPAQPDDLTTLAQQILVFQYRGRFHAVDHQCPHQSHPLSRGTVYDIEDFGVVFSAGLTCSKHGWAFDLYTGESDRGSYRLKVWDVELRDSDGVGKEVWVRRK